jgi:hypothetical protein
MMIDDIDTVDDDVPEECQECGMTLDECICDDEEEEGKDEVYI